MKAWIVPTVAIVAICSVEMFAISHGINGVVLTGSIATIAAIGGFKAKDLFGKGK